MKEFRTMANLTQEKLAELAGVRRETVIFLEQGKYNPSLRLACRVAKILEPR
jgi:DNA-binding XRE family transcriptional regulator